MKMSVGQRWFYDWGGYKFIIEIINISSMECRVVAANEYAIAQGFPIGKEYTSWDLNDNKFCHYLTGQDKPL